MTLNLPSVIDHTLLKPDATHAEIEQLCTEAEQHAFHSVCVNPFWVPTAHDLLKNSPVKICSVIGFPLGASLPQTKVQECRQLIEAGADELDVVMNIGAAKDNHWHLIEHELHELVSITSDKTLKVIIETALLNTDEIRQACQTVKASGADFVKTSTGFSSAGATIENIAIIKEEVGTALGIKASGGIRSKETALAMLNAGATRLGTSASCQIIQP